MQSPEQQGKAQASM